VFLTGFTLNAVANYNPAAASSSTITNGPTASATSSGKSGKSGSSAGGIAAGVIVAVLVVCAIFGGVLFYFRRKRQQEEGVQEIGGDHKDLKDMSFGSTVGGKEQPRPSMWAPDERMDSGTAQHRVSTGSIADNQDFSRRILQVCSSSACETGADGIGAKPGRVLSPSQPSLTSASLSSSTTTTRRLAGPLASKRAGLPTRFYRVHNVFYEAVLNPFRPASASLSAEARGAGVIGSFAVLLGWESAKAAVLPVVIVDRSIVRERERLECKVSFAEDLMMFVTT
jgi:hypothetical protein